MDVSVIIVNYKTSRLINDCLASVAKQTRGISYEVIIVDNATETLADVIINPGIEHLKFVQLSENVGFGRANNEGIKISSGRNILFLNPDTLLVNNAIAVLSNYLDNNPACGACGGNLYDEQMLPALSFRRILPGIRWEISELLHSWPEKLCFGRNQRFNHSDKPLSVGYISGADLMMRADLARRLEGFSPEFFMYYEETDLCARIHAAGFDVCSVPSAKIQHLEGGSFDTSTVNYSRLERSENGRATYMRRRHSRLSSAIANFIYSIFLFSRWKLKNSESYKYRFQLLTKKKYSK